MNVLNFLKAEIEHFCFTLPSVGWLVNACDLQIGDRYIAVM